MKLGKAFQQSHKIVRQIYAIKLILQRDYAHSPALVSIRKQARHYTYVGIWCGRRIGVLVATQDGLQDTALTQEES